MGLLTRSKLPSNRSPSTPPPPRRRHGPPSWPPPPSSGNSPVLPPAPPVRPSPAVELPTPRPARLAHLHRLAAFLRQPPLWLTLIVCTAILVARRPELFLRPQFWAEDGALFFLQAWEFGARSLLEPYAGYLHTTQRLITVFSQQFDPRYAPALFVGASVALTLYVAARTQSSRLPFRPHVAYALAVVLVPDAFEVLLFLVNIQWVLAGGLLLLLISADARRPSQYFHDTLAAVLLGLTGPFSVLFAPLFIWRAVQRRTRPSTLLAALVLACATVQLWFILHTPFPPPDTRVATETFLAIPGMRIAASLLVGRFVPPDYPLLVETALGALTFLTALALVLRRGPARTERLWLALAFVVLLGASLYRCRTMLPGLCHASFGSRYFFAPQLVFLWLVASVTDDRRRWLARTATVVLIWMLAVNATRLRENALHDFDWPTHAARLRTSTTPTTIPINPGDWSFTLSPRPH